MSTDVEVMKEAMREMLRAAKDQSAWMYEGLPREVGKAGGGSWHRSSRPRVDKAPTCQKVLWEVAA